MNYFFKGFLNLNSTFKDFVQQYTMALLKRVRAEDKETFTSANSPVQSVTDHVYEHAYQKVYTNRKFKEVQAEVQKMTYNNALKVDDDGRKRVYDVSETRMISGHILSKCLKVTFDAEEVEVCCECKKFSFQGILCSHAVRVLHAEGIIYLPEKYILDRWRKDIPRAYMKVPVPYILNEKPVELQRHEQMEAVFESVSDFAMTDELWCKDVVETLSALRLKLEAAAADRGSINVRRQGRNIVDPEVQFGQGVTQTSEHVVQDPPDKRGRGRAPLRRKGYYSDRQRMPRRPPTPSKSPGHIGGVSPDGRDMYYSV